MSLTLEQLRTMAKWAKEHQLNPRKINTQQELDAVMELDRSFGLSRDWQIGDEYYTANQLWGRRPNADTEAN